jgi:hypothetical protein
MREAIKRRGRIYTIAIVAGVALGLALAVAAGALIGLSARTDDTERLAHEVQRVTEEIQASRAENVLSACREQNARHDAALGALDFLLAKAGRGVPAEQRQQLKQSRAFTAYLIEALVPKRDCKQRVKEQVGPTPG